MGLKVAAVAKVSSKFHMYGEVRNMCLGWTERVDSGMGIGDGLGAVSSGTGRGVICKPAQIGVKVRGSGELG